MSMEDQTVKNTVWWIASIATSVVCCSVLFVLFASYLVDLKMEIRDDSVRIQSIEERQERILVNLEILSKRAIPGPAPAALPPLTGVTAPQTTPPPGDSNPAIAAPVVPSSQPQPATPPPSAGPSITVPTVTVPSAVVPTVSVPTIPAAPAKP